MQNQNFITQLLDKKAREDNKINLDTYALGIEDCLKEHKIINWYNSIDKTLLEAQINLLSIVAAQLDGNSELSDSCDGLLNMLSDLLIIRDELEN